MSTAKKTCLHEFFLRWYTLIDMRIQCFLSLDSLMIMFNQREHVIPSERCVKHWNSSVRFSFFTSHPCVPPQVQLLYELLLSWSSTWARLQRHGILRQTSSIPEPPVGAAPSSPVRSSAGTALPDTSTCSPSADFGSPTEVCFTHPVSFNKFHSVSSVFLWTVDGQ